MLANSRFYILSLSILVSALIISVSRLTIVSDQLFLIRIEQIFGFLCLTYWYIALAISPLGFLVGKASIRYLEFARRAIGVSAFYFGALHAGISLWGQLGGLGELDKLPTVFQWSLLGGAIALLILALMAATSFNVAIQIMTYRKWKWLHRFVYLAGVLVLLHVWSIGTHLAYNAVQIIAFVALVALFGLELHRIVKKLNDRFFHLDKVETLGMFVALWLVFSVALGFVPSWIHNYHSAHVAPTDTNKSENTERHGH